MPTIQNSSRGQVVQIWGKAYIRGTDGVWRPLTLGEVVPQGAEILTEQNAIVMMTRDPKPLPTVAPAATDIDRAITALDQGKAEDAPAAGLAGGSGGDLQPGLRVERIVELVTPASISTRLDSTPVEFGRATQSDPDGGVRTPSLIAASSSIAAVEAGSSVNLGLRAPTGSGTLTITVTALPAIGEVRTASGNVVSVGDALTADELQGLSYFPPADYTAGTPVGDFGYSVSNGAQTVSGGTQIAVTPVNDLPIGFDAIASGGEDILLSVVLAGSDSDGTVASIAVRTLPANGTLLLSDTLTPVAVGQALTPAQAASLVFRPNANWNGSTSLTFDVTDNEGGVSAPATVQIQITPVNDAPVAQPTPAAGDEDTPIAVSLLGSDVDGVVVSVTVTQLPPNGTLFLADATTPVVAGTPLTPTQAAGLVFVPDADFNGTVDLVFTVTDNDGAVSSPATLPISVRAVVDPVISIDDVTVDEAAGTATFTVSLSEPTTATVSVAYATNSGSATSGADFTGGSGTLTFAPGEATRTITVAIADDGLFEGSENFTVTLSAPVNATIGDGTGVGTITDNDVPTIAVSSPTLVEGDFAVFTVSLSNPSTTAVTFTPTLASGSATVGSDTATAFEYFDGSTWQPVTAAGVTLAAGVTSVQVRVATNDDVYAEGGETFTLTANVTAGTTANASATGTATLTDDTDITSVSLTATPAVAEGGSIVLTATLTNPALTPVTVTLVGGQSIGIAAGATSGSITVAAPTDDVYLDAGSVSHQIDAVSGGGFESLVADTTPATTTVTDTIDVTTVSITGSASITEGGTASYTVSLTSPAQTAVTVTLAYTGTAADGSDYTGVATVTIPGGASAANFSIATLQDVIGEGDETLTVSIASAAGGNFESLVVSAANGAQTTTITDDDAPTVSVSSPTVTEGDFAVFTVSLSNPSSSAVTFAPSLASGTATVGTDTATALEYFDGSAWVAVPVGGVAIAAGATSVQVRVATTDDPIAEVNETFSLTAAVTSGNTANASASGTATIVDNGDGTTVSLSATPSVAEGGSIVYTATLTTAALSTMTVTLSTGETISIAAGATSGTVTIAAPGDDVYVDAGAVSRTITTTSGGGLGPIAVDPTPATTNVTDTIDTTTLSITGSASVTEGASASYTVSLTSPAQSAVTVTLTYSGTAANGSDYTGVATVTIPAGASSATFSIATIDDNIDEVAAESFTVAVASATGGNFENLVVSASNGSVATTIVDNDAAPALTMANVSVAESAGFAVFNLTLSRPSSAPVSVNLALTNGTATGGGVDYGSTGANNLQVSTDGGVTWINATSATFAPGATSIRVRTPIVNDTLDEANETFRLTATRTAGTTSNASVTRTGTITDNDPTPSLRIDDVVVNEGAGTATFTVTLSAASGRNVTVNYATSNGTATAGADFTATSGSLTFAPGTTTRTITVPINNDGTYEGAETFNVVLSGATNATIADATGVGTIRDDGTGAGGTDDDRPTLAVSSPTVGEGGFAVFTVSLSSASTSAVTFNPTLASGTATVGTDTATALEFFDGTAWVPVTAAGVTIAAGSTSVQVRVATTDDAAAEGNETFTLTATRTAGVTTNASASGTATITDDTDATTVTLSATPSVAEGGTITYTATLSAPALTAMTVTLSTGEAIVIAAGATSNSIGIAAPADDPYLDAGTVSRSIATTSGGGFEAVTIDGAPATTGVTDTVDTTTATLTATPSVAEGGTITYTVNLTAPVTGSPVVVTLTNGQSVTIGVGASSGSVTTAAPDDVHAGGGSVSNAIASASGGNFEQLAPNTAPVSTTLTDDADATTLSLTATPSVTEGGSITYTATLTNAAQTPVTVTLSNGATIAIAAGATSGNVTVAAPGDDPYLDASTVSATITTATGGNFESLLIAPASADTAVADDIDATTLSLAASLSVAEGGSIVYTATLTNAAQTPVTVTLSTGETITIAAGATSGSVTVAAPGDDPYLDAGSVSRTIASASGGNFESLVIDPTAAVTSVTDTLDVTTVSITGSGAVAEGDSADYTISLTSAAQTDVSVTLAYAGTAANGVDYTGVATVTIPAGASSATFSIATLADGLGEGAENFTVSIDSASGGNFENLVVSGANGAQTTVISDDDTPVLSVSSPSVGEGGFAVFTVSLSNASTGAITFTPTLGSGTAAVGTDTGTVLEFFDGSAWQPVTAAGVTIAAGGTTVQVRVATTDDFAAEGNETFTLTATITAGTTANASATGTATITDDADVTTLALSAAASAAEGTDIVYTATLTQAALTNTTVTLSTGQTITINAGATSGTVTIAAPGEDVYIDATSVSRTIATVTGGGFENLQVDPAAATTAVTDTIDTTTATLTATPSVVEGGTITYTVSLSAPVTGSAVAVTLANGQVVNIGIGASSGSVTAAAPDNVYGGGASVSNAIVSAAGGNFEQLTPDTTPVTTTVTDDADVTTVSLSASPSVAEGGTIVYTATLTSAAQSAVTVTLSTGETITIAAGATTGSVSIAAPGDDPYLDASTVSRTISTAVGGGFENLQINPAAAVTTVTDTVDTTTATLTATPSVVEGGTITYTVSLSAPVTGSAVTVTLANGQVVNIGVGASSASVTATAPDNVYAGGGSVSNTIVSASGGNFEQLTSDTTPVTTTVTDDADVTTVSLSATPSVAEGGTIVYTATLTSAAQSDVTVTLSSGETITITAGTTSGTVPVAAPSDDPYLDAGNVSRTITTATGGGFENLQVDPAAATTAVTDTVDTTTATLTATPSVVEGGTITYTVSLSAPVTGSDVTVTLAGGQIITIPVGASSGSVTATAPDNVFGGGASVSNAIVSAAGGNFEQLTPDTTPVTTTVTDDADVTTVSLSATPSVAEGGTIVYTATLTSAAQSDVTVTLSSGETITITAGTTSGTVPVAAPSDDPYLDAGNVSRTITTATGGGFENLQVDPAAATTAVTDTVDTTTATLTATPSVVEGGTITYTVSLSAPVTGSDVTVTLAGGQIITIPVGASSGSVTATAPDNVYGGGASVSNAIVSAAGGNFEQLTPDTTPVTTTVTDDADVTTVSLSASPSVAEGGTIVYTATLTSAAQSAVTVTLSTGETITIAAGATTGSVSIAAPGDDPYLDASTVSRTISTAVGGGFESLAADPTAASTSVTDDSDPTTVSLSATPSVAEGGTIVYTATLTNAAQTAVTVTLDTGETITIAAGATTGSISIAAPADDPYLDAGIVSRSITGTAGGNFEDLQIGTGSATTSITDDSDVTTVSITGDGSVPEGATASYTVSLTSSAQTAVTVNLAYSGTASDGSDYTGVATVTIPAGASSANFSVATLQDLLAEGSESLTVTITGAAGGNFESLVISGSNGAQTTTIVDDDVPTISVSAPTVVEGGLAVFAVSLSNASTTPVVFTPALVSGSATVGTDTGTALEYFDGSTWQPVTGSVSIPAGQTSLQIRVATTDDVYAEGSELFALNVAVSSGNTANTSAGGGATITDDTDTTTVSLTATPSVAEGGTIVYTATLSSPALTAMTLTLSNGATISITAGSSSGTVGVAAPTDDVYIDADSVSATLATASGGGFEALSLSTTPAVTTVTDTIDTTTATLTATPSVAEGGTITYTVSLSALVTGSPVAVTLANGQVVTIGVGASSASVTATAPDNVYGGGASVSNAIASISGGDFEQLSPDTTPVTTTVTDDADVTTVTLTATPSVAEGGTIVYTATLTNPAQTAVVVTLSTGETINIAAGSSSGTVSIAAPGDDPYIDASTVSRTISTATGGNFESLQINPAAAVTSVTDDSDTTTIDLSATPTVAEGGTITYTATLSNAAQTAMTVTLSGGATISIAAGAMSGSVSVAAPSDDPYVDAGSVTRSITGTAGGNFEDLQIGTGSATTSITDTINATTVTLSASAASVTEGGSIVYTASVSNAVTGSPLVINLSNGQTITIPVGATSADSPAFAVRADDAYAQGTQTLTVGISSTSGASFEALTTTSTATTTVTDDADATTVTITASAATVVEGGSITYTASVNNPVTGTPLVVTLSNGQTITIPVGASSASGVAFPVRPDDAYAQGAQTLTVGITGTSGGAYEALTTTSTASTTVTDDSDATTVTVSTATATVTEGGSIVYTVTTSNPVAGSPLVITLSNGQTVSIPVGASSASSAPFAVRTDDAYAQGTQTLNVTIAGSSGGTFEAVSTTGTATTTVIDDADATTVTITASAASVVEGGTVTYTASVNNAVTGSPLVITLTNGQTITIPVGASSASGPAFAVRADDAYAQGSQTLTVGISSTSGGTYEALTTTSTASTTVTDDADATTVTVSTATATVTEGGSIVYTVSASNAVTGTPLVVTLSNGQTVTIPVGATSASSAPFAVRPDDAYAQGTQTLNVTIIGTSGAAFEAVTAAGTASTTVTDDADATTVTITASAAVVEGGSITYTASVNNAVTGSPLVITLTNGQTITIPVGASSASGAAFAVRPDDAYAQGTQTLTVGIASTSGGAYEALTTTSTASTTVTDDSDATTVTVSTATATVAEGGSIVYTVTSSNPVTGSPLVVTLSNGQTVTIPVGASSASSAPFAVRADDVYAQGTQTLAVTATATSGGNFEDVTLTGTATTTVTDDADATTLSITGSTTVTEGASGSYTLTLTSPAQTAMTVNLTYSGTAANGSDYTGVASVTIPAGASSATFNIGTFDDTIDEVVAESFTVAIGTVTGGNFENLVVSAANNSVTTSITDNDAAPTITAVSSPTATEGANLIYAVSLSNASTVATTYAFTLGGGTADAADYGTPSFSNGVTLAGGVLTVPAGVTSFSITLPTVQDAIDEASETVPVTVGGVGGLGTITDDDPTPSLSIGNVSVNEGAGTMTFTVTLSAASGQTVTVGFATTVGGTATAGSDYTATGGLLTFAPSQTSQTITVAIADDALTEASETINVSLLAPTNATIAGSGVGIGTIIDNDTPPEGRDATLTTLEDTALVFGLSNFLMNDAEQGNDVNPSAVRIDTLPGNGSLFLNGVLVTAGQVVTAAQIAAGQLTFVPAANANGTGYASFNFSVRDASGLYDTTPNTITVNVTPVSDGAPDARNDMFMTTVGTPITLTAAQLLANDTLPDGAVITSVGAASGGALVDNGNGTYTWTPSGPGNGTFTYTLTDQDGQTDTATVRIVANAAADDLATVNESALPGGTGAGTVGASGNLFANDSGNTAITSITFNGVTVTDGGAGDVDARAGFIGVNSTLGRVVVDSAGAGAGDYTYTLLRAGNNSAAADDTALTEVFSYDANSTDAALRVTVTDDAPQAVSRTIQVSEDQVPSYRLVLVLDVSGSMDTASAGGAVKQYNDDGTVTVTTRLDLARQALAQLVEEYYNQAQNVSITLITFASSATVVNPGAPYTTKDAAVAAILAADGSGGTNYTSALTAAQSAFGTVDPSVRNAVYFVSDGAPSQGDLTAPATSTGYAAFVNANNISSYAVGVGTGIANTGPLNGIHNVDANGNGVADPAIIVPDLNDLGSALLSTVPLAYGGNVVSSSADGNVLGADGGFIQTVTVRLDTNGDGTRDTDVTFTHDPVANTISRAGTYPPGFPISGDLLTLDPSRGFGLGSLTFNFSTGDYTYFTGGTASEGDSFSFTFVARDGDGDVTPPATLTVEIADGQPIARPDTDTLLANQTLLEGNVITGLGTDGGLALGGQITSFSANGAGADDAIDGAQVTSILFKGVSYLLTTAASGTGAGFTWSVAGGQLTWTAATGGEQLVFADSGYYRYTPPTAALPTVPTNTAVTTNFNSAGNAAANGVVLSGINRTGGAQGLTYSNPGGTADDGVGVTGGDANGTVDNLETLVVSFSQATHPRGVQGVSFVVSANQSNLGASGGSVSSLTYTVFDVAGNELGQFYSTGEGTVTMPAQYSNIGRIEIEANSAADARITSVSFSSINVNSAAVEVAPLEVGYTLTDADGDASNSTLTLRVMGNNLFGDGTANTLTGTAGNDRIDAGAGNDSVSGGAGSDLLIGGAGNDTLNGNDGIDELRGGAGNDTLDGGNGNDILVGGMGNDALTGGAGADVFRWELADRGVAGTPAVDTIADFSTVQGDQLDLRDLLQGEMLDGGAIGNLGAYLFVERSGGNTVVHVSSNGGFSSGYNAGAEDQTIVLTGVDLTSGSTLTSQQVIADLLNNNRLTVDP